ncbi:MAG: carboxylesterase family protein [Acidobacteriota bacterium]
MKKFCGFLLVAASAVYGQVPAEVAKQLVNIGRGVCVPQTSQVYRPLHANPPYAGIAIARDLKFGPDEMNVLDVFSAEKGGANRPVLIYVSGGAGNRQQGGPNGDVFYDNVMVWATKNGMVGVNMQRRAGSSWDDPGKDVGLLVRWVNENISKYKGNPGRVFIWSQSAGNAPVASYISHPAFYGPKGLGLKGAVFMSSPGFSILPATVPTGLTPAGPCMNPDGSAPAPVAGKGGGGAPGGGKGGGGKGGGKGPQAQPDAAELLARSSLAGLQQAKIPYLVSAAELDAPSTIAFAETLRDQLCAAKHCPAYLMFKQHSHISEVMSPNTKDDSVTGPILKWIKNVK